MSTNKIGTVPYSLSMRPTKPGDADSPKKIYATLQSRDTVGVRALAQHIKGHGSTFTVGELQGVINDLISCTIEVLKEGFAVEYEGLCKFYLTASCQPSDTVQEFSTSKIKKINLRTTINEEATAELQLAALEYAMTRDEQAEAKRNAKSTLPQKETDDSDDNNDGGNGGNNGGSNGDDGNDDNAEGQTE